MNILIYINHLQQDSGGIRQYSIALLNLFTIHSVHNFYIYINTNNTEIDNIVAEYPNFHKVSDTNHSRNKLNFFKKKYQALKRRLKFIFYLSKITYHDICIEDICCVNQIDLVYCPFQFIPNIRTCKLVTTLHDIQEIHFPEYFSAEERAVRANANLDLLRRSDFVVVSYEHIKFDIIKYFNVPSDKIFVLPHDLNSLWINRYIGKEVLEKFDFIVPEKYLLYPANTWKHKNHLRLIKAVSYLKNINGLKVNLVFTGHMNQNFSEIKNLVDELNINDQIYFIGIVEESILYSLYKKSNGVIIASTYEAGSYPLYESILLNIPVICSNVTSLPETIGAEEYTFNPFDIAEMATLISKLWIDSEFIENNFNHITKQSIVLKNQNVKGSIKRLESLLESSIDEN